MEMQEANDNVLLRRIKELNKPMLPEPTGVEPKLSRMVKVKAVIFDIYGTLFTCKCGEISSAQVEAQSVFQKALRSSGFQCLSRQAGNRANNRLKYWIDYYHMERKREGVENPEVDIKKIWEHILTELVDEKLIKGETGPRAVCRIAVEYECRVNPIWPMPHLRVTLESLMNAGMKLGIVSNAQFYTLLQIQAFNEMGRSIGRFLPELCAWSFQLMEAKPSIRLLHIILEQLAGRYDISPAETLCVGNDMLNDITPAAQLGCKTALFAGDKKSLRLRRQEPRCTGIEPDLVITSLEQLSNALG